VKKLEGELRYLEEFVCSDAPNQAYIDWFRQQIQELAEAALGIGKPISF
jgi:hypothetical protein